MKYIKAFVDKISHPDTIEYGGRQQALPILECLGFPPLGLQERVDFVEKEPIGSLSRLVNPQSFK